MTPLKTLGRAVAAIALLASPALVEAQTVVHPQDKFTVRPPESTMAPVDGAADGKLRVVSAVSVDSALRAGAVRSVGRLERPPEEVFGEIVEVLSVGDGAFAVLDGRYNQVRVFRMDGDLIDSFGQPGRGPREFEHPVGMAAAPEGTLWVADRNGSLTKLRLGSDSLQFIEKSSLPFPVNDLCNTGEGLFVHSLPLGDTEKLIHQLGEEGSTIRSFGRAYTAPQPVVQTQFSQGKLACSGDRVYLVPRLLPEIRAYDTSGRLRWVAPLAGFQKVVVESRSGGGTQGFPDSGFHHVALRPVIDPGGHVWLQARRLYSEQAGTGTTGPGPDLTYLLTPEGEGVRLDAALPQLAAVTEDWVLTRHIDPFPRIGIHRR